MPRFANEIIVPTDFSTITAAADFDTIRVLPGTYSEGKITIDKSIQLLGAQASIDARSRTVYLNQS
jgi:hypothetical protein